MAFIAQPQPVRRLASRASARWGTLGLALGAGLAAALLVFLLVRGRVAAGAAAPADVSVVVAVRAVPPRTRLTADLLQVRSLSAVSVPADVFSNPADLIGKITVQSIPADAVISKDVLASPGAGSGLAFTLPPSQRAVTVALDPADGVDEFAYPGDHVDILATDEPGSGPAETRTVLQNVTLLAVGTQTSPDAPPALPSTFSGSASHVTVAVSPAQAQALVLAAARGKIHLALRPAGDDAVSSMPVFPAPPISKVLPTAPSQRRIVSVPKPDPLPPIPLSPLPMIAVPPRPSAVTITVIKGSQSQTVSVAP